MVKKGDRVTITYEGREFEVIVIDPNGLGKGSPSVGLGYRMIEKHSGIPNNTLSDWTIEESTLQGARQTPQKVLKLPSSKSFRVLDIKGQDENNYTVIEISDWFNLIFDLLENPGRTSKALKPKLLAFLKWFAIKGFYADVYTELKGTYTKEDNKALSKWMMSRLSGILVRNQYTDFLQSQGCEGTEYAIWTDYIYLGLFGKQAWEMKSQWKLIEGNKNIGRNYISETEGLEAVAYCEEQVPKLYINSLEQAHDDAIKYAKHRFSNVLNKLGGS